MNEEKYRSYEVNKKIRRQRRISTLKEEDDDPLSVVVNLFDVAMVFAVSLMVAMVMHMNMSDFFGKENMTIVKNPGKENMEIITKEGNKIKKYIPSKDSKNKEKSMGKRVGTAYQLDNGEIVYIPEN